MFFGSHSAFGVYSKRALAIMATILCVMLDFRYQIALYFCCNLVALLILWLFCAHTDPPPHQEDCDAQRKSGSSPVHAQDEATICNTPQTRPLVQDPIPSGDQTPTVSQARIQPKVSLLDLRLTDTSNRSLQDSIWATPTKSSLDKTPTRNTYTQVRADLSNDDLSSNQAERYLEEVTLQDKMKAFERKNTGTVPWFDGAFQPPKDGRSRLRRHRSYPKLRHSVLTWWAGVEQEEASGELPRESDQPSEFEEHSDCSVCEAIQPWDSWSAAVHNPRATNKQDTSLKTRRILTPQAWPKAQT